MNARQALWHPARTCPICGRTKRYCAVSLDGNCVCCRFEASGAYRTGTDRNGAPYYLHHNGAGPLRAQERHTAAEPTGQSYQRADDDTLNKVYRDLMGRMSLSPCHREQLLARGFPDRDVTKAGYRTLPAGDRSAIVGSIALRHVGLDPATIPGMCRNHAGDWTLSGMSGLLIPVRDLKRRIVAIRVRPDEPGDGGKYRWLSCPKYSAGSGARPHVPGWITPPCEVVRLTEGELKADLATVLSGVLTISAPGVAHWRTTLAILEAIGAKVVRLAFDADAEENIEVARHLREAFHALRKAGYELEMEKWEGDP
jgi:hypothetical protein